MTADGPQVPVPPKAAPSLEQTIAERVDQELKACLDRAAEGLHWVGPDGIILWANQTELDLLGYSRDEYIGHHIAEFHVDQAVIDDILARLTRGETLNNYEAQLRCKDGSIRHVLINSNVLWREERFLHTRCFTRDVTERHLSAEIGERLADLVEHSHDAIIAQDLDGVITSWNPAAERIYGYSAAEAIGRSIRLIIPDDRAHEEKRSVELVKAGERVPPFDTVRLHKNGTAIDVALTVSPIRNRAGQVVGLSKIARDISERRRIEQELRESQHQLLGLASAAASLIETPDLDSVLSSAITVARDLFRADAYAVWRSDAAGDWHIVRSVGVSERFAGRIVHLNADRRSSVLPFSQPVLCEDVSTAPMLEDLRDAYREEGISSMIIYPLTIRGERSGTMVFYARQATRYRDVDVRVGSALANLVAAAVTTAELHEEQRFAREAADHARQRAAFLAEASAALGESLDYQRTLKTVANLAVPTVADWCAVDIMSEKGVLQRLAVAHVDPAKVELARTLEERYPTDPAAPGGVHEVLRTGKPILVSRIATTLIDAAARDEEHRRILRELQLTSYMCVPLMTQGRAFGVITLVSAESAGEYSEDDLRFALELAARASLAVDNARSYARANEASRLKDEFLATLSHELRTPLSAVLGYARMMRIGTLRPDKYQTAIEVIERNGIALKQIIEDVLDISRIVSGRLRLDVEPVDLPAILQEAVATVTPAAQAKGVQVETVADPRATAVSGDADRLLQVIWNLLSNAIKFTPRGGKVQVRLARVNSHVEIVVSDNGRGIDADFLPMVFDRFRQGDSSPSRTEGGLGLGLAIARELVELHGGTIAAASGGRDQGSTFTVKLPLMIVQPPADPSVREQPSADRVAPSIEAMPRLDGIRILAVDDEPDALSLLKVVLESAGAAVTTASSASAALDALRAATPDVMVADIGMPSMDGLQLIRAVRQLPGAAQHMPAAALTAYARAQDRVTSLASGYQMHLVKPIDPVELIVAVSALASRLPK